MVDYGPYPFCVFCSWFSLDGFEDIVHSTWSQTIPGVDDPWVIFKKKLHSLKNNLRSWNCRFRMERDRRCLEVQRDIDNFDSSIVDLDDN